MENEIDDSESLEALDFENTEEIVENTSSEETLETEETLEINNKDCIGCPDGKPDEVRKECGERGTVEFCSTLIFPKGFSLPPEVDPEEYVEENFDIAAYFVDGCFKCWEERCTINTQNIEGLNCGPLTTKQILIKGTIKYLSSLCLVSDSAPEAGSQAAICDTGLICIEEPTIVCIGCQGGCEDLRVVGAKNVEATLKTTTCDCSQDVWEIRGELKFACEKIDNDNKDDC